MTLTNDQLQILRDINATKPLTPADRDWAVKHGYAVLAEDGDIDLSQQGRALIDTTEL